MRRLSWTITACCWLVCATAQAQWPCQEVNEALSFKDSTDTGVTRAAAYAHDSVKIWVHKTTTTRVLAIGDDETSPIFTWDILLDSTAGTTFVKHTDLTALDNIVTSAITTAKLIVGSGETEILATHITSSTIAVGTTSCTLTCSGYIKEGWCVTTSVLGPDDGGLFEGYGSKWEKAETGQIDVCITSPTFCILTVWGRFDRHW